MASKKKLLKLTPDIIIKKFFKGLNSNLSDADIEILGNEMLKNLKTNGYIETDKITSSSIVGKIISFYIHNTFNSKLLLKYIQGKPLVLTDVDSCCEYRLNNSDDLDFFLFGKQYGPIRINQNYNFIDLLSNTFPQISINIEEIIDNTSDEIHDSEFVRNLIRGKLTNISKNSETDIYTPSFIIKIRDYLEKLIDYFSENKNIDIIFHFESSSVTQKEPRFIRNKYELNKDFLIIIYISLSSNIWYSRIPQPTENRRLKGLEQYINSNPDKIEFNHVSFINFSEKKLLFFLNNKSQISELNEKINKLESNTNSINLLKSSSDTKSMSGTNKKNIQYDINDKFNRLKVIEIILPNNSKQKFLLGLTGNLYLDDDLSNNLVGKIENLSSLNSNIDYTKPYSLSADLYWCDNYIESLSK